MKTFRVVGSHPINVSSGYHVPGTTGVELTDIEAEALLRSGAVEREEEAGPAPRRRSKPSSDGLSDPEE